MASCLEPPPRCRVATPVTKSTIQESRHQREYSAGSSTSRRAGAWPRVWLCSSRSTFRPRLPAYDRMDMRILASFFVLVMLATPGLLAAQDEDSRRVAPSVGVLAGIGSGPIDAAAWGVEVGVPIWRYLAVRAEYSGWGNGLGGTTCVGMPPESHRCSVSGRAGLVGLAVNIPVEGPVGVFAEIAGGRFTRDWLGDQTVKSPALSLEAGARLHLLRGLSTPTRRPRVRRG